MPYISPVGITGKAAKNSRTYLSEIGLQKHLKKIMPEYPVCTVAPPQIRAEQHRIAEFWTPGEMEAACQQFCTFHQL